MGSRPDKERWNVNVKWTAFIPRFPDLRPLSILELLPPVHPFIHTHRYTEDTVNHARDTLIEPATFRVPDNQATVPLPPRKLAGSGWPREG